MKHLKYFRKEKLQYLPKYDYISYVGFRYHRLFSLFLMQRGRKLWAFEFYIQLRLMLKEHEMDPYWMILLAFLKIAPEMILLPITLGGRVHKVPMPIHENKMYTFVMKWILGTIKRDKSYTKKFLLIWVSDALVETIIGKPSQGIGIREKLQVYETCKKTRHLTNFLKY